VPGLPVANEFRNPRIVNQTFAHGMRKRQLVFTLFLQSHIYATFVDHPKLDLPSAIAEKYLLNMRFVC
jgi:hypothetical protein